MQIQTCSIRQALSTDRKQIMTINRKSWADAYRDIFTQSEMNGLFNGTLTQDGSWVSQRQERLPTLVAQVDQQVVGFIGMATLREKTVGEVTTFYILPDYQGQGIGQQLWDAALLSLRAADCKQFWVWVLQKAVARKFYEKQGGIFKAQGIYSIGQHEEIALGYYLKL